jgi:hypothetical protein
MSCLYRIGFGLTSARQADQSGCVRLSLHPGGGRPPRLIPAIIPSIDLAGLWLYNTSRPETRIGACEMGVTDIAIPLSALFPPSPHAPSAVVPSPSFALLGPLPPTSPLHLALNYIASSELPEYTPAGSDGTSRTAAPRRERALIVTGPRATWTEELMDDDEDYMREHGSEFGTLSRLKRVDTR